MLLPRVTFTEFQDDGQAVARCLRAARPAARRCSDPWWSRRIDNATINRAILAASLILTIGVALDLIPVSFSIFAASCGASIAAIAHYYDHEADFEIVHERAELILERRLAAASCPPARSRPN